MTESAAAVNQDDTLAVPMTVSEKNIDDNVANSPVLSPSRSDGLEVFEDSDSDMSNNNNNHDEDPWGAVEQIPCVEIQELQRGLSLNDLTNLEDELQPMSSQETTRRCNTTRTREHRYDPSYATTRSVSLSGGVDSTSLVLESSSPSASQFRQARRATAFAAIVPVALKVVGQPAAATAPTPRLEAIAQKEELLSQQQQQEEEHDTRQPSFREFALLSWSTNKLSLLSDDHMFVDDGPRALDAFLLNDIDFMDIYPEHASRDSINPKALSRFCFPDGLRIRIIPRVAMPGAMKKGWAGVGGDRCHVLVVRFRMHCALVPSDKNMRVYAHFSCLHC